MAFISNAFVNETIVICLFNLQVHHSRPLWPPRVTPHWPSPCNISAANRPLPNRSRHGSLRLTMQYVSCHVTWLHHMITF